MDENNTNNEEQGYADENSEIIGRAIYMLNAIHMPPQYVFSTLDGLGYDMNIVNGIMQDIYNYTQKLNSYKDESELPEDVREFLNEVRIVLGMSINKKIGSKTDKEEIYQKVLDLAKQKKSKEEIYKILASQDYHIDTVHHVITVTEATGTELGGDSNNQTQTSAKPTQTDDRPTQTDTRPKEEIMAEIEQKAMYMIGKLNMPIENVIKGLAEKDYEREYIVEAIQNIQQKGVKFTNVEAEETKSSAKTQMISGIGIALLGAIITVASYALSSAMGGTKFKLAWGLVVGGIILFFKGLIEYNKEK